MKKISNELKADIGMRIQKARNESGLSQEQLAEALDVSKQYISDLERGVSGVSVSTLRNVCIICNVSSDYILFGISDDHEIPFIVQRVCNLPENQLQQFKSYTSLFIDLLRSNVPDL